MDHVGEGALVGGSRRLAVSRKAAVLDAVIERGTVRVSDLADELGVTPVTVRRDISDLADQGLVRRVHGGATRPDENEAGGDAPGVRGLKNRVLGMLVPSLDYYWPGVVRGAEEEARTLGLRVSLRGSVYEASDERPDIERLVSQVGVDGLLLAPTMGGVGGERMVEWLSAATVPFVLLERTAAIGPHQAAVEAVVTDHVLGASMAIHHLASLGHTRIGVALSARSPHTPMMRRGWMNSLETLGLSRSGGVDVSLPDRREAGIDAVLDAVIDQCLSTSTTALLVHSDPEAIRLVQRCEDRGIAVPGQLSVVSYDDEVAGLSTPTLSAIRPPRRTIGRTAVNLLAARLADPGRPVHQVTVSPTLYVRESSGPPASS